MAALPQFDVLVVGGGPAGLSAALTLGRVTRRVLLAADGPPRNVRSPAAHNIFTRDGEPPGDLLRIGRSQLAPYDVTIRDERVVDASREGGGFLATLAGGDRILAQGVVLAIGVRDVLPPLPGMEELWGTGVFHCPYCHGWEVAGRPLAVYGGTEEILHITRLVRGLTDDLVLLTDGPPEFSAETREQLVRHGVVVREERVERLVGSGEGLRAVRLEGGEEVRRAGLFVAPKQELASDLPDRLGCDVASSGRVEADETGRTSVPGVFVAGDARPGMQSVSAAAASGALAGARLNYELIESDW